MFGLVIVSHTGGHWLPTPLRLRHGQFTLCPCSIYYRTGNRIPLNLVILKRSHHTMLQNKRSSLLWAILIDSGGWRHIKQSVMRRFFVSRQEGISWPFEVSRGALEIFSEFFTHIYAQKWGSKDQKTWFNNLSSWKTRDLDRPEGRGCGLKFFWVSRIIFHAIGEVPNSFIG